MAARRIGLLGGSFNPVHFGHLRAAEEVREDAMLDEVWLVLSANPPHKGSQEIADAADRMQMLELAIGDATHLRIEACELARTGFSYTIDTVRALSAAHPGVEFSLILGLDAFREIHSWHRYDELLGECDQIVISRPPDPLPHGAGALAALDLPIAVRQAFWYEAERECFRHRTGRRLEFRQVTGLDISASKLRSLIREGRSIRFLTAPGVVSFVAERGLYGGHERGSS
jgi:nicotinate-nucleotide adenylyltransferase